jgi:hypothetical protein
MSKIFRKTRQHLLSIGKIKTYLKYAIGEIALVVIGILIALQINNSNTRVQQSNTELKILQSMKENLNSDIQEMEGNLKIYSLALKSTIEILQVLNIPEYETDSLNIYFGHLADHVMFIETTSAYENLKTIGFEIIKSDSLKKSIMHIYGKQYQLIDVSESIYANYINSNLNPVIFDNLIASLGTNQMSSPVDTSELKNNQRFNETLKFNIAHLYLLKERYTQIKLEVEALVEQIDAEIEQRK